MGPGVSEVPRYRARPRRGDAGSVLLEAVIAVSIVAIVMLAVTAVLVTGSQSSNRQRSAQAAVQIAATALDQVQIVGNTIPTTPVTQTINGVEFQTSYATCLLATRTSAGCDGTAGSGFTRVTATVTWQGSNCPASGCSYQSATLISNGAGALSLPTAPPEIIRPSDRRSMQYRPTERVTLEVRKVLAPPLIFTAKARAMAGGDTCAAGGTGTDITGAAPGLAGFSLDPTTGVLTAQLTTIGRFCLSIAVTDANLQTASTAFVWDVVTLQCSGFVRYWDHFDIGNGYWTYLHDLTDCVGPGQITAFTYAGGGTIKVAGDSIARDVNPGVICPTFWAPAIRCVNDMFVAVTPSAPGTLCLPLRVTAPKAFDMYLVFTMLTTGQTPADAEAAPAPCGAP